MSATTSEPPEFRQLARAGRLVAAGTLVSRGTGLVRTLALAAALGLGTRLFDSYSVANNVPNIVLDLLLGGVLTSVAVPLLVRARLRDAGGSDSYAPRLVAVVFYILGPAVLLSMLFAPWIVDAYASGFTPAEHHVAVVLTRFFLPQVLFYGLAAVTTAVINTAGRFGLPTWTPVANNLVVIATAVIYFAIGGSGSVTAMTTIQEVVVGVGTTLGVAVQAAILVPCLRRCGRGWIRAFHPGRLAARGSLRRAARMAGWVSLYAAANQVTLIVVTRLATGSGKGGLGVFTNAYTIFQLPYALVAVTVITTLAPRFATNAATGNHVRLTADVSRALRVASTVLVPATAALVVLGPALAAVLFAHGNATAAAVRSTGSTLVVFGLAVLPFSAFQILVAVFYATQDTRTPALVNLAADAAGVAVFFAVTLLLPASDRDLGLAGGYLVEYLIGCAALAVVLRRRLGRLDGHRVTRTLVRLSTAAALAGGLGLGVRTVVSMSVPANWLGKLAVVTAVAIICGAAFIRLCLRMKIGEVCAILPPSLRARTRSV